MKRILLFTLIAWLIGFAHAQKPEQAAMLEKFNLKSIESVTDAQGSKVDAETGALRVNRNEYFKSEEKETEKIVLFFLQERGNVYGLNSRLDNIKIANIVESPAGKYAYLRQYVNEIPVFATNFIIFINKENTITYTLNEFRNIDKYGDIQNKPSVNINDALKTAIHHLNIQEDFIDEPKTELVYFESIDKGLELAWKININAAKPMGDWQLFVSANAGHIIHVQDIAMYAHGSGTVFNPNPLVSANVPYGHNNCYQHNSGATNFCLDEELIEVTLKDLTYENGLYKLKGPYCVVEDLEAPFGHPIPELPVANFNYTRDQLEFGAVMCYYYVDLAARRILELGYNLPDGLKNLRIDPHGFNGEHNARYRIAQNYIDMGSGYANGNAFVPSSEDADVILHEYGHAIQWIFGSADIGYYNDYPEVVSVLEGSADYWETSFKRSLNQNNWAKHGAWYMMYDTTRIRRTDRDWVYPTDYISGYIGGEIWSSALMKIWGELGRDITDQLFLESHLIWGQSPFMKDAAEAFMQADVNLYHGAHLCDIIPRLVEHGLVDNSIVAPGLIMQNTIWNNYVYLTGSVSIQRGATLTIKSIVRCQDDVTILVNSGCKLILDNATLINACPGVMWQGIIVNGYAALKNGRIENAKCGINVQNGGMIEATDAHFVNNTTNVQFEPLSTGQSDTSSTFTNTNFTLNCNYLGNLPFDAHLKMTNSGAVSVAGCTFTSPASANTNNGILVSNTSTIWTGNNQLLSVPVCIGSGAILTNLDTISCNENAKITVLPGGKLIVDGGTLKNANANQMWQGIYISGDSRSPQTPQYQGIMELKNDAVIENAKNAIVTCKLDANGNPAYLTTGGIIQANNAFFKNNRRSVEFMPYPPISAPIVYQSASYFNHCTFTVNNNNLFAGNNTSFSEHIRLREITGVKINGCTFENTSSNIDRGKAIYSIDAGYTVDELCSGLYNSYCECTSIPKRSVFAGFDKAIASANSMLQYAITIDRSNFLYNTTAGISFAGINNPSISRLNMSLSKPDATFPTGIYLDNCTGYKVESNEIYSNYYDLSTGIWVMDAGTDENRIYRNTIFLTRYGIKVSQRLANASPFFPSTGLQFICNDFNTNHNDITVQNPGQIRGMQGALNSGADNLFSLPNAWNFVVSAPRLLAAYYHDAAVQKKIPLQRTPNVSLSQAIANPCGNTLCSKIVKREPGLFGKFTESLLAEYRELNKKRSAMMNVFYEKGYDLFLTDYYNGIIENKELFIEAMAYHEEILAVTEHLTEISNDALSALKTDSIIDLYQIRDWYDEIYTLSAKYSLAETYYQLGAFEEGYNTLVLIPKMYTLNENEMIEHNNYVALFKFKNEIRENGRTMAELKENEIEQMMHFAKASHGLSALTAQSVLCFFYEICIEEEGKDDLNESPCYARNDEEKSTSNIEGMDGTAGRGSLYKNIVIHPNPTPGALQVTSNKLQVKNIEIFDVYGRKVSSHHLIPSSSHQKIDISHLNSGIYFVKIATKQGEVVRKVIKQ